MGYSNMEKMPKGVVSSDKTGMKMGSSGGPNSTKGTPSTTGAKAPAGATASDASGERTAKLVGGVAMGKADGPIRAAMGKHDGRMGEMKGSVSEAVCYDHKRSK